jgi:hypothetical protein
MLFRRAVLVLPALVIGLGSAAADPIRVGVSISTTGPAASLGIPQRNSVALLPKQIDGQDVEYIVLDDAADASKAVANARKLIDQDKIDVLIGSSTTPSSLAMIDVAAEKHVPMISLAASAAIIAPMDSSRHWIFKTPQNDSLMAEAVADHMQKAGVKTVGFIGFSDAYGDGWLSEFTKAATPRGITLVATEKYARPDTSKAPSCPPAPSWSPPNCPTATRSRRWHWTTSPNTTPPTALAPSTISAPMPTTRCCWSRPPSPRPSPKASPARPLSAKASATAWKA